MDVRKPTSKVEEDRAADDQADDVPVTDDESVEAAPVPVEAAPVPPVPPRHNPLWTDMLRLMLVLGGCFILTDIILSALLDVTVVFFDPQTQSYLADRTNMGESLGSVLNDPATTQYLIERIVAYAPWMSVIGDLATVALFLIIRKKKLFTSDLTTTQPVNNHWSELGVALLFIFGIQMVLSLVDAVISLSGYDPASVQSTLLGGSESTVSGVILIMIVAPFLEEWIFRGAILRQLQPYGVNFAIVTQATLFGLWHGNLYQGVFAFLLGLVLGYVAVHFSLKWSYALHAVNNGLAILMGASWMPEWVPWAVFGLGLVASVVIIVYFRKVIPVVIGEGAPQIEHPFRQGWRNPAFIVVTAVLFVMSFISMVTIGN